MQSLPTKPSNSPSQALKDRLQLHLSECGFVIASKFASSQSKSFILLAALPHSILPSMEQVTLGESTLVVNQKVAVQVKDKTFSRK